MSQSNWCRPAVEGRPGNVRTTPPLASSTVIVTDVTGRFTSYVNVAKGSTLRVGFEGAKSVARSFETGFPEEGGGTCADEFAGPEAGRGLNEFVSGEAAGAAVGGIVKDGAAGGSSVIGWARTP